MSFVLMRSKPEYPLECFQEVPNLPEPWTRGTAVTQPQNGPLQYRLSQNIEDPLFPMYELPQPLMSRALLTSLQEIGVTNIQSFPAVLHHPASGALKNEYVAFNIVGLVATTEIAADIMAQRDTLEFVTDEIDGMVSDYSKIPDWVKIARLADRMGRIIVHEKVRAHIDQGPESGLVFFELT